MASLKQSVKQLLVGKQHRDYEKKVFQKKMSYSDWIEKQEKKVEIDNIIVEEKGKSLTNDFSLGLNGSGQNENEGFPSDKKQIWRYFEVFDKKRGKEEKYTFLLIFLEKEDWINKRNYDKIFCNKEADVILFASAEGEISKIALPLIYKKLQEDEDIILIYGDEDVKKEGKREKPWFKPDWSPDTFLSCFYFGSLLAVRARKMQEKARDEGSDKDIYSTCYELAIEYGNSAVYHIPEVLFHGRTEGYETVKDLRLPEGVIKSQLQEKKSFAAKPMISVIIPSKDNPEILFTCIHSLIERTKAQYPYEIVIIDNGSNETNKAVISKEVERICQLEKNPDNFQQITYHYRPMPFNFSKMCNAGADLAKGDLYLFLNDDMEIIQPEWLTLLADKAVLPHAGAVGAKLLYPDSRMIQHAGITNLRVGPAHKLQFLSDEEVHYYGKNRGVHNVMAVTGACLLIRKEVFEKAGGFAGELAVAFNDVDLCYSVYEMGYYNIVRNDVILYHHESLSRGKDGESEEKQIRLLREKDILYERHQDLYGRDPFYHKYLTTDMLESEYSPAFHYQVTLDMPWSEVAKEQKISDHIREDKCVVIGMESAMDIYKWKYGVPPGKGKIKPSLEDTGYYFQGYSFIIGADNACYKKTLLLQNRANGQLIRIPVDERFRPDIKNNLKDQLNVDLTGFAAKVRLNDIPEGTYRFGMLAEDKCSRQKLVNWSSWVLQTGDDYGL